MQGTRLRGSAAAVETSGMTGIDSLSAREARRVALHAQGLLGARIAGGPAAMLRRLRAVQIDTISVLGPLARARRLRPPRCRETPGDRSCLLGRPTVQRFRVLGACGLRAPDGGLALLRVRTPGGGAQRGRRWHHLENAEQTCAGVLERLRGRRTAHGERPRRRQARRTVVGLVRDQDRPRMDARYRRRRVRAAAGFPTGLRLARACRTGGPAGGHGRAGRAGAATA